MRFAKFNNEKGVTLVELLAALGLFAVVIALASSVIIQLVQTEDWTSGRVELTQDTNVLVSELRNTYQRMSETAETETVNLPYQESDRLELVGVVIDGGETLVSGNGLIEGVPVMENLPIQLTTEHSSGETLTIESVWTNKQSYEVSVIIDSGGSGEDIVNPNPEDYEPAGDECDYYSNIFFERSKEFGDWEKCQEIMVHGHSAWFWNNLTLNNVIFHAEKDLFIDGSTILYNESNLIAGNNVRLSGHANIHSNSRVTVGSHLVAEDVLRLDSNAVFSVGASAQFYAQLEAYSNSRITVDGYFFAEDQLTLHGNATLTIGENASFNGDVEIQSNASITITGDAIFNRPVSLQNNAGLIIQGDAHFADDIGFDWSNAEICVEGEVTYGDGVIPDIDIIENAASCD
ncbi:PulJ/GspJ family protein [Lentibacillus sediminis]|uniref:PulJ/GspJ family protein n=1 Tax=Lentibacillus sediminis TaxID=1940529 RepID=UPI000C1C31BB|nr:prepilin-type N-terminal cleavage/methylation domain-containing protein [Lentibacillus sediminis]